MQNSIAGKTHHILTSCLWMTLPLKMLCSVRFLSFLCSPKLKKTFDWQCIFFRGSYSINSPSEDWRNVISNRYDFQSSVEHWRRHLKNVGNQTVLVTFIVWTKQWKNLRHLFKSFRFYNVYSVWNLMRLRKWWQNFFISGRTSKSTR